jgi:hypothetical protein
VSERTWYLILKLAAVDLKWATQRIAYWIVQNQGLPLRCQEIWILLFFFTGSTAPMGPDLFFQFHDHFTDGRTLWTSDQLVARPLPKHRTTQTQNKHIHTPNIHALSGIWTHDPCVRASEDSSCLRSLNYCDRLNPTLLYQIFSQLHYFLCVKKKKAHESYTLEWVFINNTHVKSKGKTMA